MADIDAFVQLHTINLRGASRPPLVCGSPPDMKFLKRNRNCSGERTIGAIIRLHPWLMRFQEIGIHLRLMPLV
jgi:hypothetical protein